MTCLYIQFDYSSLFISLQVTTCSSLPPPPTIASVSLSPTSPSILTIFSAGHLFFVYPLPPTISSWRSSPTNPSIDRVFHQPWQVILFKNSSNYSRSFQPSLVVSRSNNNRILIFFPYESFHWHQFSSTIFNLMTRNLFKIHLLTQDYARPFQLITCSSLPVYQQ